MNDLRIKPRIAVVIPYYQRKPGLLVAALRSVFSQTIAVDAIHAIVVDDESPCSAVSELESDQSLPREQITLITQKNGGAGSARNTALNHVPHGVEFVAFLDSDDSWRPHHLENAVRALEFGYDAYFSDWWSFNFPDQTNFERIGALQMQHHRPLDESHRFFELGMTPIEHVVGGGGGVIQTSTVVYRYAQFPHLRFREEFYNGQDFFFWMDLGELGAHFVFSVDVGCENGEGINIYQGAGWGTERSLQRLRNELFVWTSVERFYSISSSLKAANRKTIRNLQQGVIRDVLHRVRRRLPISMKLLRDIIKFDPGILAIAPLVPFRMLKEYLHNRVKVVSDQ